MRTRLVPVVLAAVFAAPLAASSASRPPTESQPQAGGVTAYVVPGVRTREQRTTVARTGTDIVEVRRGAVTVLATRTERRALARLGFRVRLLRRPLDFPPADAAYHNYAEANADINQLAADHPATVHLFSFGSSYEGRDLVGIRISNDATDRLDEPGVLYVALHHAREHLTVEVALSIAHLFAESTDPAITQLVATRQIYFLVQMNPDGSEYDIATGSYRSWRKNRQPNAGSSYVGTDPNRNYGYRWGCCGGSSGFTGSSTYRGPSAFSAPEVVRVRDFVDTHPNIRISISYHTYGDLILYPYGYTYTDVPSDMTQLDHDTFVAMAREMARTTGYTAEQSSDLYITDGDYNDWMYGAKRMYPFTFELGGGTFYPGAGIIASESVKNHAAAIYVAQMADCPTRAVGVTCDGSPPPPPPPAPPPPRPVTAVPNSFTIYSGTRTAGDVTALGADDGALLQIASTTSGTRVTSWYGRITGVPNALTALSGTYRGSHSASCSQGVYLYNWSSGTWARFSATTAGTVENEAAFSPTSSLASYVSGPSGNGDVAMRVHCTRSSNFTTSAELMKVTYTPAQQNLLR
jgi:carboxypeptidase T